MRRMNMSRSGVVASLCLLLWLPATNGRAQSPPVEPKIETMVNLEAEPKLHTKVWLLAPESTLERTLADLTARTIPLTHFKLQAQSSLQHIAVSCYVAGVPLRDVLNGLAILGTLQWNRMGEDTLLLGFPSHSDRADRQGRIAYYGMRIVRAMRKQPADLRDTLKQGRVRLGSLPPAVQQSVQGIAETLVRANNRRRGRIQTPLDPETTSMELTEEADVHEPIYRLQITVTQQAGNGSYDMTMRMNFTPSQAAAYLPASGVDRDLPEWSEAIRTDSHFAQAVTLDLHAATLSETLKNLFTATHLPLLAEVASPHTRADIALTKVPMEKALDQICAVYGYDWQRQASGVVTLMPKQP